jgi:phage gp45-like
MSDFGFSSGLPVGSDVVVAFRRGSLVRRHYCIKSPVHRQSGLNPGETIIYSQWGQLVKLTETGITIDAAGQPVDVVNSTVVTITASEEVIAKTPVLKCTGDIIDNCESNTATLKQLREAYNVHDHPVKNVQGGNSTINSDKPSNPVGG